MTIQFDVVQDVADILVQARRSGVQAAAASVEQALESEDAAYAIQDRVAQTLGWFDSPVPQYWKSGGPAKDKPAVHAPLPLRGVFASPADASDVLLFTPHIEAEVALRLGSNVTPDELVQLQHADLDSLIDAMAVSIEIVDNRWVEGFDAPALLRLADMQAHGALVLGEWQPYQRRDWMAQTCSIRIGTQEEVVKQGTHAYGDPVWGVLEWLRHVTRHGATVPAGTVVTTGTWCGVLPAEAGNSVEVIFEGLGSAEVQL